MLPNYIIYEVLTDYNSVTKKGMQIIIIINPIHNTKVSYLQDCWQLQDDEIQDLLTSKVIRGIASKGSGIPLSRVHPSLIEFYQNQIGLSRYYSKEDVTELKDTFGTKYLTDALSTAATTINIISEVLEPVTILPTIIGRKWEDLVGMLGNTQQLGMIPAIIEELSKVTLNGIDDISSLEVNIEGFYKIQFDILSSIGRVIVLKITTIDPA